jgi:CDP-diglyceride synthetase
MKKILNIIKGIMVFPLMIIIHLQGIMMIVVPFIVLLVLYGYTEAINIVKEQWEEAKKERMGEN